MVELDISANSVQLDCSVDSGICVEGVTKDLKKKIQEFKRILFILERDKEAMRLLRERLSRIAERKIVKKKKDGQSVCNVCFTQIDTDDSKTCIACCSCAKNVCRGEKCSEWVPTDGEWRCQLCSAMRDSYGKASTWVQEQYAVKRASLTEFSYPMRARSEIYIPLCDPNESAFLCNFESVSEVPSPINPNQKQHIRDYIEEVLAEMIGGSLENATVEPLSRNNSDYQQVRNGNELQGISNVRLRRLIESVIAETIRQPPFASAGLIATTTTIDSNDNIDQSENLPLNGNHCNGNGGQYFESKKYHDLLATAVLNKIVNTHGNGRHSESSPDLTSSSILDNNHNTLNLNKTDESISSSSSVEPRSESSLTDPIRSINKDDPTGNYGNFYDDVANDNIEADRESVLSDFISSHMVPLPHISAEPASEEDEDEEDFISVTSSRDANWEDNWLFKKKKSNKTSASVGMLVPAPKEDIRALIGDKPTDEVSDLSEVGSDTDDSSLEMVSASLEPLNDRLVNKHLIGGKNTKIVLDEIVDRTSMISTSSLPDDVPPYTETKNEFVVSNDGLNESETLKISVNNCNKTISNEAVNSNVTKTISTKVEKLTKESHVTEDESIVPPPNDFTDDEKMRNLLAKFNEEQNNKTDSGDDNSSSLSPRSSISCALSAGIDRAELDAYEGITDFCVEDEEGLASEIESSSRRPSVIEILAAIALGPMLAVSASDDRNILTELELSSLMELNELAMAQLNAKANEERRLGVIAEESFESAPGDDHRIETIDGNEEADLLSSPKMVMEAIRELVGKDANKLETSSIIIEEITEESQSEIECNLQKTTNDSEQLKNKDEEYVEKKVLEKIEPENIEEQDTNTEIEEKNTEEILTNDHPDAMRKTEEQTNQEQLEIEETFEIVSGEEEIKEDMVKIESTAQCEDKPREEIHEEQNEMKNETEKNQGIRGSKLSEDAVDEAQMSEIKPIEGQISNDEDNNITMNSLSEDLGFEKVIPEDTSSISDESLHTIGSSSEYSEDLEGDATSFFIDDQNISVTAELSDDQKLQQFKDEIPETQPIIRTKSTKESDKTENEFILPPPTAFCDEQLRKLNEDAGINETVQVTEAHINAETVQVETQILSENSNNEEETTINEEQTQTHNENLCTDIKNDSEVKENANTIQISEPEEMTISKEVLPQSEKSEEPPDKQSIEDNAEAPENKSVPISKIEAENEKLDDSLKVEQCSQDENTVKNAEDSVGKQGEQESKVIVEEQTASSVLNEPPALKTLSQAQLTLQEISFDIVSGEDVPVVNPIEEQNNELNSEENTKTETKIETIKLEDSQSNEEANNNILQSENSPNDKLSEENSVKHQVDEISEAQSVEEVSNKVDIKIYSEISENIVEDPTTKTTELNCELENQETSNQQEIEESRKIEELPIESTTIDPLEGDTVKTEPDDKAAAENLSSENMQSGVDGQPSNVPDNELVIAVAEILNSPNEEKVAKSEDEPVEIENTINTSQINESITEEISNGLNIASQEPITEIPSELSLTDKQEKDSSEEVSVDSVEEKAQLEVPNLPDNNTDTDLHEDQTKSIEETQMEESTRTVSKNVVASEQDSEDLQTEIISSESVIELGSNDLKPKYEEENTTNQEETEKVVEDKECKLISQEISDNDDDQTKSIEESTPTISENVEASEQVPLESVIELCPKDLNPKHEAETTKNQEDKECELIPQVMSDTDDDQTKSIKESTLAISENVVAIEQDSKDLQIETVPLESVIELCSKKFNPTQDEEITKNQEETTKVIEEVTEMENKECESIAQTISDQSSEILEDEMKPIIEETPLQTESSNSDPLTADIASVEPFFATKNINETEIQNQQALVSEAENLTQNKTERPLTEEADAETGKTELKTTQTSEAAEIENVRAEPLGNVAEQEEEHVEPTVKVAEQAEQAKSEENSSQPQNEDTLVTGLTAEKLDEMPMNIQEAPEISDEIKTECSPAQNDSPGIEQISLNQQDEKASTNLTESDVNNQSEEVEGKTLDESSVVAEATVNNLEEQQPQNIQNSNSKTEQENKTDDNKQVEIENSKQTEVDNSPENQTDVNKESNDENHDNQIQENLSTESAAIEPLNELKLEQEEQTKPTEETIELSTESSTNNDSTSMSDPPVHSQSENTESKTCETGEENTKEDTDVVKEQQQNELSVTQAKFEEEKPKAEETSGVGKEPDCENVEKSLDVLENQSKTEDKNEILCETINTKEITETSTEKVSEVPSSDNEPAEKVTESTKSDKMQDEGTKIEKEIPKEYNELIGNVEETEGSELKETLSNEEQIESAVVEGAEQNECKTKDELQKDTYPNIDLDTKEKTESSTTTEEEIDKASSNETNTEQIQVGIVKEISEEEALSNEVKKCEDSKSNENSLNQSSHQKEEETVNNAEILKSDSVSNDEDTQLDKMSSEEILPPTAETIVENSKFEEVVIVAENETILTETADQTSAGGSEVEEPVVELCNPTQSELEDPNQVLSEGAKSEETAKIPTCQVEDAKIDNPTAEIIESSTNDVVTNETVTEILKSDQERKEENTEDLTVECTTSEEIIEPVQSEIEKSETTEITTTSEPETSENSICEEPKTEVAGEVQETEQIVTEEQKEINIIESEETDTTTKTGDIENEVQKLLSEEPIPTEDTSEEIHLVTEVSAENVEQSEILLKNQEESIGEKSSESEIESSTLTVEEVIKERQEIEVHTNIADDLKSQESSATNETIPTISTEEETKKDKLTDTGKSEEPNSQGPSEETQDKTLPTELLVEEEILTDRENVHEGEKSDEPITNSEEPSKSTQKSEEIEIKEISPEETFEKATDSNVTTKLDETNSIPTFSTQNTVEILKDDVSIDKTLPVEEQIELSVNEELISEVTNKIPPEELCVVEGSSKEDILDNQAPKPDIENLKDAPILKLEVQTTDKEVEFEAQETTLDTSDLNLKTDDEKLKSTLNVSDLNLKTDDEKISEIPVTETKLNESVIEEQKQDDSVEDSHIGVKETAGNENLDASDALTTECNNEITLSVEPKSQKPTEITEIVDTETVPVDAEIPDKNISESHSTNSEHINEDRADESSSSLVSSEGVATAEIIQPEEDAEASKPKESVSISEVTQSEDNVQVKEVLDESSKTANAEIESKGIPVPKEELLEEKEITENVDISLEKGDTLRSQEIAEVENSQELADDSKNEPHSLEELQAKEIIKSSSCSEISPLVEDDVTKEEASINQPIETEEPKEKDKSVKTEEPINEPRVINNEVPVDILPESSSGTCLQENILVENETTVKELSVPNEQMENNPILETTITNEITNELKSPEETISNDTTISVKEEPTPEIAEASKCEEVATIIEETIVSAEMIDNEKSVIDATASAETNIQETASEDKTALKEVMAIEEISSDESKQLTEKNEPPISGELVSDLNESQSETDRVSEERETNIEVDNLQEFETTDKEKPSETLLATDTLQSEPQIDQTSLIETTPSKDIQQETKPGEETATDASNSNEDLSGKIIESQKGEEQVTEVKDEPDQTDTVQTKEAASDNEVNEAYEEVQATNVELKSDELSISKEIILDTKDIKEECSSFETAAGVTEKLNDEETDSEASYMSAVEEEFNAENISSIDPISSESTNLQESEASENAIAKDSSEVNKLPVEVMNQTSEMLNTETILSEEITLTSDVSTDSKDLTASVYDVKSAENDETLTNVTETPEIEGSSITSTDASAKIEAFEVPESLDSQKSSVSAIDKQAPAQAENIEKSNNIEAIRTEETIEQVSDSKDTQVKTEEVQNQEKTVEMPPDVTENSECIPETVEKAQNEAHSTDVMFDVSQDTISNDEKDVSIHSKQDNVAKDVLKSVEVNQIESTVEIQEVSDAVTTEESVDEKNPQNIPEPIQEVHIEKIESIQGETFIEDSNIQTPVLEDTSVLSEEQQTNIEENADNIVEPNKEEGSISKEEIILSSKEMHGEVTVTENIQNQNNTVEIITDSSLEKNEVETEKVKKQKSQDETTVTEAAKKENQCPDEAKLAEESQNDSKDSSKVSEELQAENTSTVKSSSTELLAEPSKPSEIISTDDTSESKSTESPEKTSKVAEELQADNTSTVKSSSTELIAEPSKPAEIISTDDTSELKSTESPEKTAAEALASKEISEPETPQEESNKVSVETTTVEITVPIHDIDGAQASSEAISTKETSEQKTVDKDEVIQDQKPSDYSEDQAQKSDNADVAIAEDKLSEVLTEQVTEVEEIPPIEVLTAKCKIITHPPLQPTESLIESAQYLYDKISYPVLETTRDISAPNLAEELRMAADRNDTNDASKAERVIPQSIACESRCFTPDPQLDQPIASDSVATEQPNAQDADQDRISSDSNCTDDSTTTVIDTFGSMESQSNSDSGEEFSPDGSTDRDSSATATTANNSIITTTNKATNQSHIYSQPPPPQPQPVLRTESACSKLLQTRTTGGNEEHVDDDPLKHLVPGSIAEREYKKWYNAVDMPNNPYSAEALRRRLSGGADRAFDLPNISPCNEENSLQLGESPAAEADIKAQERDYSRYSRDYYINDAKQASGTTKKSPTSPPQVSSPTSTASSIELGERVECNLKTVEKTPVIEMCHKLEKQSRVEADIYLATPVHVIEDIPEAFADKNPIQKVGTITSLTSEAVSKFSSETSSTLTNESLTPSEDSDTIRIYDLKKQETRLIKETTQTTTITVPKSPEKKGRPTELDIMPTLAPPTATVSSKCSTPTSFKFLQPKRKLINPSQVLSIDLDTTPITPSTPEKPVIEAEVAHAMPSVKALAKAFLMTTSTSSSENKWRKARAKSPLQFFKTTTSTSTATTATAAANFSKVIQKQPEPVVPDTTSQGSEDATIASDLSSLETDPPSRIDGETLDSNASEDRALSPVVLSGCLRNNIAFFENLKNK